MQELFGCDEEETTNNAAGCLCLSEHNLLRSTT